MWRSVAECDGVWWSVEVYGVVWQRVAGCGGVWRSVAECDGVWWSVEVYGGVWQRVAECGGVWRVWRSVAKSG